MNTTEAAAPGLPGPSSTTAGADKMLDQLASAHYLIAAITVAKIFLGLPLMIPGIQGMQSGSGAEADAVPAWFDTVVFWMAVLMDMEHIKDDPLFVALVLFVVGSTLVTVSVVHGAALAWIGWCIKKRKRFKTVLVFSWLDVVYVPFGLVISIAVILLFKKDDIRAAFGVEPKATSTTT